MFGYTNPLSGASNATQSVSAAQFPTFGDYTSLSQFYQTSLGPSGIPGYGPQGSNITIAGGFGGVLGGDMGGFTTSSTPQYQTVVNQQPIYQPFNTQIDTCAGLIGMPCQGQPGQYNTNWQQIVAANDPNNTGQMSGSAINNLVYIDPSTGQATPLSQFGVTSVSDTGCVQGQQLVGYQPVVSEQLTGYIDMTAYASNTGSNISINFVPASAGQALQQAYAGYGNIQLSPTPGYGYPTDPGVAYDPVAAPNQAGGYSIPYAATAATTATSSGQSRTALTGWNTSFG
jgi:hypothetical protein